MNQEILQAYLRQEETPAYIFDLDMLKSRVQMMKTILGERTEICFAMKATLAETQNLLKQSGFAPLYVRCHRDSIIIFALTHGHSLMQLNTDLYDHSEPVIE